ncbi:COG4-domain-containing protein [Pisolithus albus]|nr:COG4-domain-containing protein [Pisolithus albus]
MAVPNLPGSEQPTQAPRRDPRRLTNLGEILSCLSSYQSEEAELSASLTELLSDRDSITQSLQLLQSLIPSLDDLHGESSHLVDKVSSTAHTAERVGGRVKSLDQEMGRISQAVDRVGQVMELKSSLMQLQASIDAQDWESATRYCARAMSLPPQVISGPFAEAVVPTAENHLPPSQTLQTAREELLTIFSKHFAQASRSRDAAATSRYFKLFPLIGWEAEGLEAYASFVVDLVRVRAPTSANTASPLYHVTVLTALFENVATIVDQHHPVVEKYYGKGKMQIVVERLLEECDRVVRSTLSSWREDRAIGKKVNTFTANWPSDLTDFQLSVIGSSPFSLNSLRKQHPSNTANEDDNPNPREIDKVLSEIAGMCGRWNLFRKFLVEQLQHKELSEDLAEVSAENEDIGSSVQLSEQIRLLEKCHSQGDFDELLSSCYVPLEIWYIRAIIEKAHRRSTCDFSQVPLVSTTPDDVFYMLKTYHNHPEGGDRTGLRWGIKSKLDDAYRNPGSSSTRPERSERESRSSLVILLNDLDVSLSHMDRLTKDLLAYPAGTQLYLDAEQQGVKSAIMSLFGTTAKFAAILKSGMEQMFSQLMRAKLRTLIPDVYKDVSYILDENSYANAEHQDVVRKRFTKFWEGLADGYKDTFTENNYRVLFGLAIDALLRPWEKHILTLQFSELGAVHFDRDLRSIVAYLSSQTTFGDIREKFVRLQQISLLLNLDHGEDVEAFYNGSGTPWKLSLQEAKSIAGLKV